MVTHSRREVLRGAGLGTVAVLSGCSGLTGQFTSPDRATSTPKSQSPASVPCSEQIWGEFDPDHADHITIGPLTFARVRRRLPTVDIESGGETVKARVVIDPGTVVTLVVPEADREHVALDYGANTEFRGQPVRFEACGSDTPRQYNGGIFVTDPRCVTLGVFVEGENTPRKAVLPVGTTCTETSSASTIRSSRQ
jgi:hypothetical protein